MGGGWDERINKRPSTPLLSPLTGRHADREQRGAEQKATFKGEGAGFPFIPLDASLRVGLRGRGRRSEGGRQRATKRF